MGIRERLAGRIAPDLVTTISEQSRQLNLLIRESAATRRFRERLADLELWYEDVGWERLGPAGDLDMPENTRQAKVRQSRILYRGDPNALRIVQLYTDYVVGDGLSIKAANEDVQVIVDSFLGDRKNKKLFSSQGQRGFSNRLLVDGETFPVYFRPTEKKRDGIIKVRRVSSLQIIEILTDPEDELTPLWYLRQWNEGAETKYLWYADRDATDEDLKKVDKFRGYEQSDLKVRMSQVVFHALGTRGQGLLFTILDWLKEFKLFMERRATIMAALALFAWKTKTTGTPKEAELLKAMWGTEIDSARMPPAFAGARLVETEGADTIPIKTDTGASAAQVDGTMLFQQICVGSGIPPHMLARGEYWRMATATALDWTLERQFKAYQSLLREYYNDTVRYQLEFSANAGAKMPKDEAEWALDLDFPPLTREKTKDMLEALSIGGELGVPADEILYKALVALGVDNPSDIVQRLEKGEVEEAEAAIRESIEGREEEIIESLAHFAKMLRDDSMMEASLEQEED